MNRISEFVGESFELDPSDSMVLVERTESEIEAEPEANLQFNRARHYDPQVGRWLNQDPLGFDPGQDVLFRCVYSPLEQTEQEATAAPLPSQEDEGASPLEGLVFTYDADGSLISSSAPVGIDEPFERRGRYVWTGREIAAEGGLQHNHASCCGEVPSGGLWIGENGPIDAAAEAKRLGLR